MTLTNFLAPVTKTNGPILVRGEGSYVWDKSGRKYLDINAGQFSAILGHSHVDVAKFICDQATKLQNTSTTTFGEEAILAANMMHEIAYGMDGRTVFLSTGAEANECALRFAKHLTNRPGVIGFENSWHGLTLGTECVSISRRHVKPTIPYTFTTPAPPVRDTSDRASIDLDFYVDSFAKIVSAEGDRIAAAIFEPIISSGGMIIPPKEYFHKVRKICTDKGILLIFDECQTGFGRTGSWFQYQYLDCLPDIVVGGKGMGLGFPVSAVIFSGAIVPDDGFKMQMYSTHQNDPMNCGLVAFAVQWLRRHDTLTRVREVGSYLLEQLTELSRSCAMIYKPRGCGLMCGFDLFEEGRQPSPDTSQQFLSEALSQGCILQVANAGRTVRLLPNYLITKQEIDELIDILRSVDSAMAVRS